MSVIDVCVCIFDEKTIDVYIVYHYRLIDCESYRFTEREREAAENQTQGEDDERKANTHDTQGASAAFVLVDEDTMQYKYNEKDEDCFPCKAVCAAWRRAASFEYSDMK